MQAAANARGVRLRPHSKTHKSPLVAQWQIERGAVGICCAKLGEAEVFVEAGIADIRLPYPLKPSNADRVIALLERTRLSFIVDHPGVCAAVVRGDARPASGWRCWSRSTSASTAAASSPIAAGAVEMVRGVAALPGLRLPGPAVARRARVSRAFRGRAARMAEAEARAMRDLADRCRNAGVAMEEVSAGATPSARFSLQQEGFTEFRPGNYVYFDRTQVALGAAALDDCALTVLATVVSKPAPDRVMLDCGSKTLTADGARGFTPAPGYGIVVGQPDQSAHRAAVGGTCDGRRWTAGPRSSPGDRVRVLPNHSCVVSNLVDQAWLVDGDTVEPLPIAARGGINKIGSTRAAAKILGTGAGGVCEGNSSE